MTALLLSHYNPCGYIQPRRNLMRCLRQLAAEGLPVFVAELAYGEEPFFIPASPQTLQLRTSKENILWSKENLLNLLERQVPEEFDAIAWLDGDVWFQRLEWYEAVGQALERFAVVQPFSSAIFTAEDGRSAGSRPSVAARGWMDSMNFHPGFAWAARRSLWREAGGLYEEAVLGHGDTINACAFLPNEADLSWTGDARLPEILARKRAWCDAHGGCGVVEGNLWHEWHGERANRRYVERNALLAGLDRERDLHRREDGLIEWSAAAAPALKRSFAEYFVGRKEDGEGPAGQASHPEAAREGLAPWIEPAGLAAMQERLRAGDAVLEYGGGGSTLWLAERVRVVHTIEHDQAWAARLTAAAPANVTVHWRRPEWPHHGLTPAAPGQFAGYLAVAGQLGIVFDAVLVDGRARIEAAQAAAAHLKPGGWLFFHDWTGRGRYHSRVRELTRLFSGPQMAPGTSFAFFQRNETPC